MYNLVLFFIVAMFASGEINLAKAEATSKVEPIANGEHDGAHDFDFEFGSWKVHHKYRALGTSEWIEYEGISNDRPLMDGSANVEDNTFYAPKGIWQGVALRAYDAKAKQWAIWWLSGRNQLAAIDPPVKGSFTSGVGTFYADGDINGKPMRTRFIWSNISSTAARWEQAFSADGGKTWETNWIMEFQRAV